MRTDGTDTKKLKGAFRDYANWLKNAKKYVVSFYSLEEKELKRRQIKQLRDVCNVTARHLYIEQSPLRSAADIWTIKMNTMMILYYIEVTSSGLQQTRPSVRKFRQCPSCRRFYSQLSKICDHFRTDLNFENKCHFSAIIIQNF